MAVESILTVFHSKKAGMRNHKVIKARNMYPRLAVPWVKLFLRAITDIPGMMLQDFFAQTGVVYLGIYLCGTKVFMTQHALYGAKVGSAF